MGNLNKNQKIKILFLVLSLIWMGVIFMFSSRDGTISSNDSLKVGMTTGKIFVPDFEKKSLAEQIAFALGIDHPIRKLAHSMEYAVLGMLLVGFLYNRERKFYSFILAYIIAVLYAATDEYHQLYVPGRSGEIKDVFIDGFGAICGLSFLAVIMYLCHRHKNKKSNIYSK